MFIGVFGWSWRAIAARVAELEATGHKVHGIELGKMTEYHYQDFDRVDFLDFEPGMLELWESARPKDLGARDRELVINMPPEPEEAFKKPLDPPPPPVNPEALNPSPPDGADGEPGAGTTGGATDLGASDSVTMAPKTSRKGK